MENETRQLRNALGRFTTGVCVVVAKPPESPAFGMTINSFASVSLEPPMVLWSVAKSSNYYQDVMTSDSYTINVLGSDQTSLSKKYSGKDRQLDADHVESPYDGFLSLKGAIARFYCEVSDRIEGGDHVIILGKVRHFSSVETAEPLVFFSGAYSALIDSLSVA